jgi:hypothetical protein
MTQPVFRASPAQPRSHVHRYRRGRHAEPSALPSATSAPRISARMLLPGQEAPPAAPLLRDAGRQGWRCRPCAVAPTQRAWFHGTMAAARRSHSSRAIITTGRSRRLRRRHRDRPDPAVPAPQRTCGFAHEGKPAAPAAALSLSSFRGPSDRVSYQRGACASGAQPQALVIAGARTGRSKSRSRLSVKARASPSQRGARRDFRLRVGGRAGRGDDAAIVSACSSGLAGPRRGCAGRRTRALPAGTRTAGRSP